MMQFKQDLETYYIPALEGMIEREKSHLKYLLENLNNDNVAEMKFFISNSEWYLAHFEQRLHEYTEYAKTLPE